MEDDLTRKERREQTVLKEKWDYTLVENHVH
jgi:hypothetical protein